jgi:hypothetical protein
MSWQHPPDPGINKLIASVSSVVGRGEGQLISRENVSLDLTGAPFGTPGPKRRGEMQDQEAASQEITVGPIDRDHPIESSIVTTGADTPPPPPPPKPPFDGPPGDDDSH